MKEKHFYTRESAAKELGLSGRHFARLCEEHHIEPIVFEKPGAEAHFYTARQVELLKSMRALAVKA